MRIVLAVCWQRDAPDLCQRAEGIIIVMPQAQTSFVDAPGGFQLPPQVGSLNICHQVARTNIAPGIFIGLFAKELAVVGAFLADDFRTLNQRGVVDQCGTAFSAGRVVFGFVKTEAANMTHRPNGRPL